MLLLANISKGRRERFVESLLGSSCSWQRCYDKNTMFSKRKGASWETIGHTEQAK
jgi:hypothetical protein